MRLLVGIGLVRDADVQVTVIPCVRRAGELAGDGLALGDRERFRGVKHSLSVKKGMR